MSDSGERRRETDPAIGELTVQVKHLNSGVREALGEIKMLHGDVNAMRVEQASRAGTLASHSERLDKAEVRIKDTEDEIKDARKAVLRWALSVIAAVATALGSAVWFLKKGG